MSKEMNKVFNVGTYAFNIKVELNAINEKKMITNYSKAEQSTSSPYFGNTFVRHSTVNYETN
jgi:hypothetical protein